MEDPADDLPERLARLAPRVRLFVAATLGRRLRAHVGVDDLVQEVYLRALSNPAAFTAPGAGEDDLARALVRLARWTVIDAARSLGAARRDGRPLAIASSSGSYGGVAASAIPMLAPGPATEAASREGVERLAAAWRALDGEHRRVLRLRQLEGLPAAEAARRMGRSETAVHSLYRRALAAWEAELAR